ncbi:penicillin-insensitive murein endopeptidase [Neolewinella persica]|uniref:penicillin-insensitive murein endopeptidase n=1 Tax=Neolewinella persica TaxID=70998 RepID=UPI00037258B7|nr:penicillin-insensitive murein endopeptidase [Neolewinella persica]
MKKRKTLLILLAFGLLALAFPELTHQNKDKAVASGTVGKGSLENAWLVPYFGKNYRYFSPVSYYLLNRGYTHHRVHNTILDAYQTCETTCPGVQFRLMECANKHGGKMWPHRTHQIGLSADFMLPKTRNGSAHRLLDHLGIWHYLLSADGRGAYSKRVSIDFETMGRHLLALDDAARTNGLRIKKIIVQIDLKEEFYASPSGKKVRQRGIYFAKSLPRLVDELHDDHYHVDFELR